MVFKVKKSFVLANPHFEVQVAAHAKELSDWLAREERVAKDKENPNVPDIDRWVSCPRPEAPNPLVESAVNEMGIASYEVENDDPTPEQLLSTKKAALIQALVDAEAKARNDVLPMNKRPLRGIRTTDIAVADEKLVQQIRASALQTYEIDVARYNAERKEVEDNAPGFLSRMATKIGVSEDPVKDALSSIQPPVFQDPNIEDELAKLRSDDDNAFLAENAEIFAADEVIKRSVAQALHDIEDLTVETVDQYQIPDLTKQG